MEGESHDVGNYTLTVKNTGSSISRSSSFRNTRTSMTVVLIRQIPVLLSNDEYDIIKKIISQQCQFC